MRDMVMQMSGSSGVLSVPDEHLPGLIALVLIGPVVWMALAGLRSLAARRVGWADRAQQRLDGLPFAAKVVLFGTLVGALVHAVIVPTHWGDERITAILFIVDTAGFALAFWWTFTARAHWRLVSVAMLGGTACFYAFYILRGWETMDLVGLVTTTIEAAAALVVLSPAGSPAVARQYALALAAVPVALVSLLGTNLIAGATTTEAPSMSAAPAPSTASGTTKASGDGSAMTGPGGMSGSSATAATTPLSLPTSSPAGAIEWPDSMSTTMTGMKMAEPNCTSQPTAAQRQAAVDLVNETVAAAQKYTSLAAAKAEGYVPVTPTGKRIVHYISPSIYHSGQALNPGAIPSLVYVNTAHGAVLAAAMFLVPKGQTPPQPGGCLTQWHIHTDLCFNTSGDKVVGTDANSSCGPGSVNEVTQPMMHVWMTPVPGGPLAPDPSNRNEVQAALRMPAVSPVNAPA
ncbi:MAG TPA: hypothetical protein VHX67_10440 [Acidimicrobiales bacterium]|jgi:hypothetical protein|nr:hypothetical protein [Acidimicrobiales bacterium]